MAQRKAERTVDDVYNVVVEIQTSLAERKHLDSDIIAIKETIDGNGDGKPGLKTRMALAEEREQKRDRREWFITTVLVVEMIGLIFTMVTSS